MRTGNVIRDPDGDLLWVVTDIHDYGDKPTVEAVAIWAENCSAVQELNDHDRVVVCGCEQDPECADCHRRGTYTKHIKGWKHSHVLASCVKDFIMSGVKRAYRL